MACVDGAPTRRLLRPTEEGEDCQMMIMVVTVMMIMVVTFMMIMVVTVMMIMVVTVMMIILFSVLMVRQHEDCCGQRKKEKTVK